MRNNRSFSEILQEIWKEIVVLVAHNVPRTFPVQRSLKNDGT